MDEILDTEQQTFDGKKHEKLLSEAHKIFLEDACRVAIATKDDFDLTPADHIQTGCEAERRNRGFFLTEATVGMD